MTQPFAVVLPTRRTPFMDCRFAFGTRLALRMVCSAELQFVLWGRKTEKMATWLGAGRKRQTAEDRRKLPEIQ
jgi:hypothetical protein